MRRRRRVLLATAIAGATLSLPSGAASATVKRGRPAKATGLLAVTA